MIHSFKSEHRRHLAMSSTAINDYTTKPLLSEHRRHLHMSLKAINHEIKLRTIERIKIDQKARQAKYLSAEKDDKSLLKIENYMIPNTPENLLLWERAKNNDLRLMNLRGAAFRRHIMEKP